ncbi:MAG: AI-2E family transporter [Candidatus Hydrogenedentota bacterium]|nr:MAG: AI-2E family transporter [Candidatus Hydrogenedentota bacterium]
MLRVRRRRSKRSGDNSASSTPSPNGSPAAGGNEKKRARGSGRRDSRDDSFRGDWARRLAVFLFLLLAAFLLVKLQSILMPFLLAWIAAYLVTPIVDILEFRLKFRRSRAVTVVLIFFACFVLLVLLLILPPLIRQSVDFVSAVPDYVSNLRGQVERWAEGRRFPPAVRQAIDEGLSIAAEKAREAAPEIAAFLGNLFVASVSSALGILSFFFSTLIFLFVFFFFLRDYHRLRDAMMTAVPPRFRDRAERILREMSRNLRAVLRGQLVVAGIMAALYAVGLLFVGIPYAIPIGILAGFGNFLPYIGPLFGLVPAVLLVFFEAGWVLGPALPGLVGIVVVFGIVQFLEGFLLTPRLAGGAVGLGPVATLFAISAGGVLLGIFGVVAALPVAAMIKVLLKEIWELYLASDFYRKST